MAFTPFVDSDLPSMANFNEKFLECIADAVGQAPKIETTSYVGTGTYGVNNKNFLTFSGKPKIVIIIQTGTSTPSSVCFLSENGGCAVCYEYSSTQSPLVATNFDPSGLIEWYGGSMISQLNTTNYSYFALAII